jgi:tetratricopeptide (TPR) repeat protein
MPEINPIVKLLLPGVLFFFLAHQSFAQATIAQAQQYAAEKNYDKAISAYNELYSLYPDSVYSDYLHMLIAGKKYKPAEKLVEKQMTLSANNFYLLIDLGSVYEAGGKEAKAREQYDAILQRVNGDDMVTQSIVKAFLAAGLDTFAILTYEKAIQVAGQQFAYFYSGPLARLYAKHGNVAAAIDALMASAPGQYMNVESVKSEMLEILGEDPEKLRQAEKALIKKINAQPGDVYCALLLTWIYTQKNDWDQALVQIEALDERNKENGRRLIDLAHSAVAAKQYEAAAKAYAGVIAQGTGLPYYMMAKSEQLSAGMAQLANTTGYKPEDVSRLVTLYDSFFVAYPRYYATTTASEYALLEARYAGAAPRAIEILQTAINEPDTRRDMAGKFKLQMGDYYVLTGQLWDASLTYSQVDKEFKQDAMGEDARFRNAKLAYYMGDFDWAQRQLSILKAATSELIANDALYLSVLITENVEDTNKVPLQRFANAGLLVFQNKDKEATTLLDSINQAYPKHPLNDDILMMRAKIALKHLDYDKALGYLKNIYDNYHDDVLGDDAVFEMAEIYQNNLNKPEEAKHYYEQLIIDYPGSTYVQTARQRLSELTNGVNP